jgi:hypothetical protein
MDVTSLPQKSTNISQQNIMYSLGLKYNCDKITHHEYHNIYEKFLKHMYDNNGSILEIGLDVGNSLKMWLELFKNAFIYGIEINRGMDGERYKVFKADQSNEKHLTSIKTELTDKNIFFIVDDGSHIPEHQLLTFNILFPLLSENGVYIIEDIETSYWTKEGLYGYPTRYGYKHPNSIIEVFKDVLDTINCEFSQKTECRVKNLDYIDSITFSRNCIIIVKKKQNRRKYRMSEKL